MFIILNFVFRIYYPFFIVIYNEFVLFILNMAKYYKYYKRRRYVKRTKKLISNYYMDTIEFCFSVIPVKVDNNSVYKMHTVQSNENIGAVSISNILVGDEGATDLSRLFGFIKINAISIICTPAFSNHTAAVNGFQGDVILVYFNSLNNKHTTYLGGCAQGKYCLHLNPFTVSKKYVSLRGFTNDFVGLSDVGDNFGNIPGAFCVFNNGDLDADEVNRNPVWNCVLKLYCTFKK